MATVTANDAVRRLTRAYQRAQVRLGNDTIARMLRIWPLLDSRQLDATIERWLAASKPVVQAQRAQSARLAANYLNIVRALEIGVTATPFTPVLEETIPDEQLTTSLIVTGPAKLRVALDRGEPLAKATEVAQVTSARSAARHAMNGGRATVDSTIDADPVALGFTRVTTSARPCAFCAMLSSRGPVYLSEISAEITKEGRAYHDGCYCVAKPIYREDEPWPDSALRYRELWRSTTSGLKGRDALNAFRRALNAADNQPTPTA